MGEGLAFVHPKLLTEPEPTTLAVMPENVAATAPAKKEWPWWVKQRRFVVPATLQRHMRNAPEGVQVILCSIVSRIVTATKKHPEHFANIPSTEFKNVVGSDYKGYMDALNEWRIIDFNNRYSNAEGRSFCKSYRLHPSANAADKVMVSFDKKQVHPPRDKSKLTNDVAKFVHRNLKRLSIRNDLLPQANLIDEVEAINSAVRVYFEQFNVHYAPHAKRLYHTVIQMPAVARKNLILKADASVPLFEYDIKSCMPVILLGIPKPPAENTTLKAFLDGDIYTAIASECSVTDSRDDIKQEFLRFVNGGVRNYVYTFFHQHLPTLAEWALGGKGAKKGMAWYGQSVEAEIMVQDVPRQLINVGGANNIIVQNQFNSLICGGNPDDAILYIPMHDGWLGIERDEQKIAATVRAEFFRRLDYRITITKTELATGTETVLPATAPQAQST